MRLICPNCSAQYEIDASLIPDDGRDVQCSNCGNTWFELPPPLEEFTDIAPEAEPVEGARAGADDSFEEPLPREKGEERAVEADDEADDETAAATEAASIEEATKDVEEDWDWPETRAVAPPVEAPEEATQAPPPPQRRAVDEDAREILRQEAEQELAKRRGKQSGSIETQSDLGLSETGDRPTPSRALRARMARLRSEEVDNERPETDDGYSPPRRDLLPDIEEINSSLRPSQGGSRPATTEEIAEHRKGFRAGFGLMLVLSVGLILAYTQAPAIASAVPSAEGAMIAYVDWANGARDAIGGLFGG